MKEKLRNLFRGQIPVMILFLILGLFLVILPVGTLNVLCKVFFGLALILSGGYHVMREILEKPGRSTSVPDLYTGVVTLVIGLFLFTNPQLVVRLLPWMLGAFLLADCIWMVKGVLAMRKQNVEFWKIMLGVVVLFAVLACFLAFYPFSQVRGMLSFAGWVFLLKGISDLVLYFLGKKQVKAAAAGTNYQVVPAQNAKKGFFGRRKKKEPEAAMDASYQEVYEEQQAVPDEVIYQGTAAAPEAATETEAAPETEPQPEEEAPAPEEPLAEPVKAPWESDEPPVGSVSEKPEDGGNS